MVRLVVSSNHNYLKKDLLKPILIGMGTVQYIFLQKKKSKGRKELGQFIRIKFIFVFTQVF